VKNRVLIAAASVCAIAACLVPSIAVGAARHATAQAGASAVAPGAPGTESYFDLARKDCVGTARNDRSKVWFTVADGVLSDTYWPTADATNVKTLQYLVTDGHSFTDLQTRDMTYKVLDDRTGMACTVIATSATHHYRVVTTYLADPSRDAVLMRTHFDGPRSDRLYVRLDPLAGGTGGGGTQNAGGNTAAVVTEGRDQTLLASNPNTTTQASNRSYAVPTDEALQASGGLRNASVGYAGTASDGEAMLDAGHRLTPYDSAPNGHVTLTARVPLSRRHDVTLALGFGTDQTAALDTAGASLNQSFGATRARYEAQWQRYDAGLRRPSRSLGAAASREYNESINVVKASEDKTFPGAIVAGLASPWGQAVPAGEPTPDTAAGRPTYFGSYREVFARDLYEAFTALLVAGDVQTARDADLFLFDRQQQPDGSMPRNSLLNGMVAPDTGGLQLDETSYPILMDWQSGLAGDTDLYRQHVIPAADFLVAHGPSDGVERWEEQSGYSPSTIAAEIAGLTAAARIAAVHGDAARSAVYQATADDFARNIKRWTVTSTGPYASSYFLRLSKTGDPNAAITYSLGNGSITADQRSVIDGGFLELVRLGILPASDPTVQASLAVVDSTIERTTPNGAGFYRYGTSGPGSKDGYGDCYEPDPTNCTPSGKPWPTTGNVGSGHLWPVLDGERGEYDVAAGRPGGARTLLAAMAAMSSGQGLEPEQAWEDPPLAPSPFGSDPTTASIGFTPGQPAGSASPLTWAQAQYARLALDLSTGRNLETPGIVTDRYVEHGTPGALPLTVSSPANGASVDSATVTVTGTTAPGASVAAQASGPAGGAAAIASATADSGGHWTLALPTTFGSSTITVTATLGRSTAYAQLSVTDVALPGSVVLTATDPSGDDNGPGTYAYPTDSSFSPGAFDLLGLQVSQTTSDVYIQARIRNLAPTFATSFGAQLLDVYVRDPAAPSHSTAAAFPQRNYTIAPADAWSERLEAQGFASVVWQDASGTSPGNGQLVVDQPSGTATLVVPRSAFGTVGPGWVFTIALTGQDGFSADQARAFTATPQGFSFGVCASGASSPICSVDPSTVPKVMDTITPTGVSQAAELDPIPGPASLTGVAVR
jgi:glucoamylase